LAHRGNDGRVDKSHGAIAAPVQVGGEIAQDFVRILMLLIDECRQIALGVKHDTPLFAIASQSTIGGDAPP
jgi:hypothetical protein